MESLFDVWSRRDPDWETRYQESIMDVFCDYGRGRNALQSARSKPFGAGYETFMRWLSPKGMKKRGAIHQNYLYLSMDKSELLWKRNKPR